MAVFNTDYYKGTDRYSDGDVEDRILELVKAGVPEEGPEDHSFPVLYHLSPSRENILSWYDFREGARVLEIGAGPGALTGLLCRRCAHVTVSELSKRRALINYERHKQYDNLEIFAGNLNDMRFGEKFDYVVLNGVFEYAGSFTEGEDPYGTFLKRCIGYLKEDGILLIAIENRLGLKYFSGAPEDHTDNYMEGLKDYPDNPSVHTFSRSEWTELCGRCGLGGVKFYYPYPDYKFPSEIFTDGTLSAEGFSRNAWNFNPLRMELFPEQQMAAALCREGVMDRFMNSFLIEAGRSDLRQLRGEDEILYAKINSDRGGEFRIQTVIRQSGDTRCVVKSPLDERACAHLKRMHEMERSEAGMSQGTFSFQGIDYPVSLLKGELEADGSCRYPFLRGGSLGKLLADAARNGETARIEEAAHALLDLLRSDGTFEEQTGDRFREVFGNAGADAEYEMISSANIDLIFDNIFLEKDGTAKIIDAEWVFDFPVPVLFPVWRAVNELYSCHPELEGALARKKLLASCGISAEDAGTFWKWADHFEKDYVRANRLAAWSHPVRKADLKDLRWTGTGLVRHARIYADRGAGFREEDAVLAQAVMKGNRYEADFELEDPQQIRALRFDPLEGSACVCDLHAEGAVLTPMNASARSRAGWIFLTEDPAYRVKVKRGRGAKEQVLKIRVTGRVETKDLRWALAKSQELVSRYRRGLPGEAVRAVRRLMNREQNS